MTPPPPDGVLITKLLPLLQPREAPSTARNANQKSMIARGTGKSYRSTPLLAETDCETTDLKTVLLGSALRQCRNLFSDIASIGAVWELPQPASWRRDSLSHKGLLSLDRSFAFPRWCGCGYARFRKR
jgi:hypothetical protein